MKSPLPEPMVRDRMLVVYNRRDSLWGMTKVQGLFSEFFAVLGALLYAEQHGAAGVRVWFDSEVYRDDRLGANWWEHYFSATMSLNSQRVGVREVRCNGWHRFGPYAWNESWTRLAIPNNERQRAPYPLDSDAEMREVTRLTQRYIRVQPAVLAHVDAFKAARVEADEFLIGLHYRGTDKVDAYPFKSPSYAAYENEVTRVLAEYRPAKYRIFLATDERECVEWARGTYGERLVLQEDSPRLQTPMPWR